MSKRRFEEIELEFDQPTKKVENLEKAKKHTLDSDEEDSGDDERYNIMNENDIEGEEEGVSAIEGDVKITPFNMKEELEEGHFDREGHFQWDKKKEITDNWLDNIDWVKVKSDKKYIEKTNRGLADSSDSEDEPSSMKNFNVIETYKKVLELMKPGETVKKTLLRLGGKTAKLSSVERWRRKKAGIVDENAEMVTKLTELTNDILTNMGNMDIYEESYELIAKKIKAGSKSTSSSKIGEDKEELDMYADDFDSKEKSKLNNEKKDETKSSDSDDDTEPNTTKTSGESNVLNWEFKWKQDDKEVYGPYPTEQMQKWVEEGYFKTGVFVRKVGEDSRFYSSSRIDFELYL